MKKGIYFFSSTGQRSVKLMRYQSVRCPDVRPSVYPSVRKQLVVTRSPLLLNIIETQLLSYIDGSMG